MLRVENWASTCANHTSGSVGQNRGIFTETADTEAVDMAAGQPREEKRKDPESSQPLFLVRVTKCRERLQ